jgi:hypothetical protein
MAFAVNSVSVGCCCGLNAYTEGAWSASQAGYQPPVNYQLINISSGVAGISVYGLDLSSGRVVTFRNVGDYPIFFVHDSPSATATTMRLDNPLQTSFGLEPGHTVTYRPDSTGVRLLETTASIVATPQAVTLTASTNNQALDPGAPELVLTDTTAAINLTGLTPPSAGLTQTLRLSDSASSTKTITLTSLDAGSSGANQFSLAASLPLSPGTTVPLIYDAGKWRPKPAPVPPPWAPSWSGTTSNPALPGGTLPGLLIPTLGALTTLTGLPAGVPVGAKLTILNPVGSLYNLVLSNASGSSTVPFAFSSGADVTLTPGLSLTVAYDGAKLVDAGGGLALTPASAVAGTIGAFPQWFSYTKTYADFSTAGTTRTLTLVTLPAKAVVHEVVIHATTAFAGPGFASYVADVIHGGNTQIVSFNLLSTSSSTKLHTKDVAAYCTVLDFVTGQTLQLKATSGGANLSVATAGSVTVWFLLSVLP